MRARLDSDAKPEVVINDIPDEVLFKNKSYLNKLRKRAFNLQKRVRYTTGGDSNYVFSGISGFGYLPRRCFLSEHLLATSTILADTLFCILVDLATSDVIVQRHLPSLSVQDVFDNMIVGGHATLTTAPR